jgi:hypothetical protein
MKLTKLFIEETLNAERLTLLKATQDSLGQYMNLPTFVPKDELYDFIRKCPKKLLCEIKDECIIAQGEVEHDEEIESKFEVRGFFRVWLSNGLMWYCEDI